MSVIPHSFITNSGSGTSVTAAGLASLAVGDLMVAHFVHQASGRTITMPAGWTQVNKTESGSGYSSLIAYKIADSGDVSGNSFQFSISGGAVQMSLHVMRFTGQRIVTPVTVSNGQANASSTSIASSGITPPNDDCLIGIFALVAGTTSVSGYSINTSSPTFTEAYDDNTNVSGAFTRAAAFGLRSASTPTGNVLATAANAGVNICQIIAISPPLTITVNDTITVTDTKLVDISILIQDIISVTDTVTTVAQRIWTKVTRNIKSWTKRNRN